MSNITARDLVLELKAWQKTLTSIKEWMCVESIIADIIVAILDNKFSTGREVMMWMYKRHLEDTRFCMFLVTYEVVLIVEGHILNHKGETK